ncbi:hypothetical protein [Hymenobacter antarcticus]
MSSTIVETDTELIITTPKKKSWVVIILLSILTLQFSLGLFSVIFSDETMPATGRIIMAAFSLTVLYFTVKGIIWQAKGRTKITISNSTLTVNSIASVLAKNKVYRLSDVGLVGVKNEVVSEGPLAMLQLLKIADRIKVVIGYGYETIPIIGGVDMTEAVEIKDRINTKLKAARQ